jgi:hypothetical protein
VWHCAGIISGGVREVKVWLHGLVGSGHVDVYGRWIIQRYLM